MGQEFFFFFSFNFYDLHNATDLIQYCVKMYWELRKLCEETAQIMEGKLLVTLRFMQRNADSRLVDKQAWRRSMAEVERAYDLIHHRSNDFNVLVEYRWAKFLELLAVSARHNPHIPTGPYGPWLVRHGGPIPNNDMPDHAYYSDIDPRLIGKGDPGKFPGIVWFDPNTKKVYRARNQAFNNVHCLRKLRWEEKSDDEGDNTATDTNRPTTSRTGLPIARPPPMPRTRSMTARDTQLQLAETEQRQPAHWVRINQPAPIRWVRPGRPEIRLEPSARKGFWRLATEWTERQNAPGAEDNKSDDSDDDDDDVPQLADETTPATNQATPQASDMTTTYCTLVCNKRGNGLGRK